MLFQHARVFVVIGAEDAEAKFGVGGSELGPVRAAVDFLQELLRAAEASVYDVDVMDVGTS